METNSLLRYVITCFLHLPFSFKLHSAALVISHSLYPDCMVVPYNRLYASSPHSSDEESKSGTILVLSMGHSSQKDPNGDTAIQVSASRSVDMMGVITFI